MDFALSEEQREVQNLARKILSEQVTPARLAAYDEFQQQRFDAALWQQLAAAGLLGVAVETAYGGMGFGFTELALLIEEAGRVTAPVPLLPHLISALLPLQRFGTAAQKERWLPGAVDGSVLLTAALLEAGPEAGLEAAVAAPATVAATDGRGYRVTGVKSCVPCARSAAGILLAAQSERGPVLLWVDPAAAGVSLTDIKYSTYEPLCELRLEQVAVASDAVLATPERAPAVLRWTVERTLTALCAHQTGVVDEALRMTAAYTSQRQQFGVPVATFQAVGQRAANCFIDVACLRLTTLQAISMLEREAAATNAVEIAKVWAGDVGHRVSYAAQHLHGGAGIDRDYPLWRLCLWARHNELMLGGSARQLASLGARIAAGEGYCSQAPLPRRQASVGQSLTRDSK